MTKFCVKCSQQKPQADFNKKKREKDGLQPYCRKCDNEHRRKYYEATKSRWKGYRKKTRAKTKQWWKKYRQTLSCMGCGDARWYVFDFHHRDSSQKDYDVSKMVARGWSKERILNEAAKCDVLCSNCHREHHFLENNYGTI